jgi:hypothetical protein
MKITHHIPTTSISRKIGCRSQRDHPSCRSGTAGTMLHQEPGKDGRSGRGVGRNRKATKGIRNRDQRQQLRLGSERGHPADSTGRLSYWRLRSDWPDLLSGCEEWGTGHCGGVDRSDYTQSKRRKCRSTGQSRYFAPPIDKSGMMVKKYLD